MSEDEAKTIEQTTTQDSRSEGVKRFRRILQSGNSRTPHTEKPKPPSTSPARRRSHRHLPSSTGDIDVTLGRYIHERFFPGSKGAYATVPGKEKGESQKTKIRRSGSTRKMDASLGKSETPWAHRTPRPHERRPGQ